MSIYGEPRNGDFARYIEELTQQGQQGAPGEVLRPARGKAASGWSPSHWRTTSSAPASSGNTTPVPPAPAADEKTPRPVSLAKRSGQQRTAALLTMAALIAALFAVRNLGQSLDGDLDRLAPGIFLAVVSVMLFNGARLTRASANKAPAPRFEKLRVGKRNPS